MISAVVTVAAFWSFVYALAIAASFSLRRLNMIPKSTIKSENNSFRTGQLIVGCGKAMLVAVMANAVLFGIVPDHPPYWEIPPHVQTLVVNSPWSSSTGIFFLAFEGVDLIFGHLGGILRTEMYVHHILHIVMGTVVLEACFSGFHVSVLLAQETSSVFLNIFQLLRGRLSDDSTIVKVSFLLFVLSFVGYRLVLYTLSTLHFVIETRNPSSLPPHVKQWKADGIAIGLLAASILQWWFGYGIYRKIMKELKKKKKKTI